MSPRGQGEQQVLMGPQGLGNGSEKVNLESHSSWGWWSTWLLPRMEE